MSGLEAMDLEKPDSSPEGKAAAAACSICLDLVLNRGDRSIAKLKCGHEFHLDCIGSAFNAKGVMQCPNCRTVEKGRWLFANGHRSSADFDIDGWMSEEFYDLGYSELPFGFQWCPFRGFTQLASLFEDGESQQNSYHELMGNSTFGDHSNASSSSHVCPYLSLHGFPHAMRAPSGSADSVSESAQFHRHPTGLGGQSNVDMINSHIFSATEPQNQNWQQQHSFPLSGNTDQSTSQFGVRLSRNDNSSQQRVGSFVHPHPLLHGSVARNGGNIVPPLGPPVIGEVRGHTRGLGNQFYQQSVNLLAPTRRLRPRGLTLVSSVAASSSAESGGFYGFSLSGSSSRNHQDGESIGRHMDRFYGWGREGYTPLPWIPVEGESQWWGPFNPNQNPQPGGFNQRAATDRVTQSRPENIYQRMPPPRMPPYM
ncbi:E3 ubiquitin-protein ligase IPI1-like isoform X2 [Typha angustifolia]|uniref:E3 ubiquitin-protein ligase IPI1-like isoform X2 n=1 Tax=Typha angustifolia TaxID=59011 RepID=UPI003C2C1950